MMKPESPEKPLQAEKLKRAIEKTGEITWSHKNPRKEK